MGERPDGSFGENILRGACTPFASAFCGEKCNAHFIARPRKTHFQDALAVSHQIVSYFLSLWMAGYCKDTSKFRYQLEVSQLACCVNQ